MSMLTTRALIFTAVLALGLPAAAQSPFISTCQEDAHISAAKRNGIESAAMDFIHKLLGTDPENAFEMMSKAGETTVTREQLKAQATVIRGMEPKNIAVQHTYVVELRGKSPGRVVCGTDFAKSDGWESLEAADVPEQAHVLIKAETLNNFLAYTVWLIPEQNSWKVQSFWMNVASLADKDSTQLLRLGQAQREKGHNFNAALLYAAAAQVANRGPNFQMGITQAISGEAAALAVPPEIRGAGPFLWKNGATSYKVLGVGPIAIGGKLYLTLVHEVSPWQSNQQVDGWNKEFLGYFKQRFPEYSDTFAGLVARAMERGSNRGFGTVEETAAPK
jgi:hypothetical protein